MIGCGYWILLGVGLSALATAVVVFIAAALLLAPRWDF